jgi:hypothetical protein
VPLAGPRGESNLPIAPAVRRPVASGPGSPFLHQAFPRRQGIRDLGFAERNSHLSDVNTMSSIVQFFQNAFTRLENLDFPQLSLLVLVIVAFGFWCLRGFGSRSNY